MKRLFMLKLLAHIKITKMSNVILRTSYSCVNSIITQAES